jgi:choline dehydrogenase
VGPADDLRAHGIEVVADLPGVGGNLQDHLNIPVQYACTDPALTFDRYLRLDRAIWLGLRYLLGRGGAAGAPFWSAGGFKALSGSDVPELQIFFTPMILLGDADSRLAAASPNRLADLLNTPARALFSRNKRAVPGFQLDVNQMHPESRGTLKLRTTDPRAHPILEPSYLEAEKDRREMVEAVKLAREVASQSAFDPVRGEELSPGPSARTDPEILDAVRRLAISGYHPVGTCKMGIESDPLAVVSADLKVRGVEGLRVVDASVMPRIVTGNTNGPTIMIAEKGADQIRGLPPLARIEV